MKKTVDIYLPLDSRESANAEVWPVAVGQLREIVRVIESCGWRPHVLNPEKPVAGVAEGLRVIRRAQGERFINFMAGWAYPDFSVSPMWRLPADLPKLMLGSTIPDFPGAVGLLAAATGTVHMGIEASRLFIEQFEDHASYRDAIAAFLNDGTYAPELPRPIAVEATAQDRKKAAAVVEELRGSIYGAVGPRSMQMWNKISEADFLKYFGISREGFVLCFITFSDHLRLGPITRAKYSSLLKRCRYGKKKIFLWPGHDIEGEAHNGLLEPQLGR